MNHLNKFFTKVRKLIMGYMEKRMSFVLNLNIMDVKFLCSLLTAICWSGVAIMIASVVLNTIGEMTNANALLAGGLGLAIALVTCLMLRAAENVTFDKMVEAAIDDMIKPKQPQ